MADKIAIDQELISAHAARVDQVASDIGVARDAGGSTNMAGGAFGLMCSFLVPPASLAASLAMSAITSAEQMVRRSATELRGIGTDMERLETDLTSGITQLGSGLE